MFTGWDRSHKLTAIGIVVAVFFGAPGWIDLAERHHWFTLPDRIQSGVGADVMGWVGELGSYISALLLAGCLIVLLVSRTRGDSHSVPGPPQGKPAWRRLQWANAERERLGNRVTELEAVAAEINIIKASLDAKTAEVSGYRDAETETSRLAVVHGKVWIAKNRAREIRRCWPDADFNKRPFFSHSWIPNSSGQACEWLQLALDWRKAATELPYIATHSDLYRNSLNFDEVMELLDDAERFEQKQKPYRFQFASGSPEVVIRRWGTRNDNYESRNDFGFFIRNGGGTANQILVQPVGIGDYELGSYPRNTPLLDAHEDVFLEACLSHKTMGGATIPNMLADLLNKIPANTNGYRLPQLLRIKYIGAQGECYISRHTMEITDKPSISVVYVNREILPNRIS